MFLSKHSQYCTVKHCWLHLQMTMLYSCILKSRDSTRSSGQEDFLTHLLEEAQRNWQENTSAWWDTWSRSCIRWSWLTLRCFDNLWRSSWHLGSKVLDSIAGNLELKCLDVWAFQHTNVMFGSCQATFILMFRDEYAMGRFLAKINRNQSKLVRTTVRMFRVVTN